MSPGDIGDAGDAAARRVCLVTGAGGLLGSALCRALAPDHDVVAVCRRRTPATPSQYESLVDPLDPGGELAENAAAVHVVHADLEADGQVQRVVEVALARFGRVDLLVNNAAHLRLHPAGLLDTAGSFADFDRYFRMNVAVPAQLATELARVHWQHRAPENRAANRNVVNVSSLSASRVYGGGQAVYAASKAALNQLTRHLAAEFVPFGVRVNAVAPNSFPAVVATERVVAAIGRLDRDTVTGRVLAVDAD
ncbi:SDR family NAD(P)-dependent oxidoreductase [Jatrophihabitans endophyticus]|uniref:SDR family NAD(P)-dependent oxidoreductase n=1 Tax=Jatrophihabitans endophyticus TaxID=1206085 RepID=UPI00190E9E6F|nr:SDR family oxidoreductase [Jatrophihabitans endophyticus]